MKTGSEASLLNGELPSSGIVMGARGESPRREFLRIPGVGELDEGRER
jgi:hypothetical protein